MCGHYRLPGLWFVRRRLPLIGVRKVAGKLARQSICRIPVHSGICYIALGVAMIASHIPYEPLLLLGMVLFKVFASGSVGWITTSLNVSKS